MTSARRRNAALALVAETVAPLKAAEVQQLRQRRASIIFLRQQGEQMLLAAAEIERAIEEQIHAACVERGIDFARGVTVEDDGRIVVG